MLPTKTDQQDLDSLLKEIEKLRRDIADREALIEDLNAFSHMVAHDLKNPLTALTGYAFLLMTRLRDTQDLTILRYLEIIDQTSTRMARIIDGLLLLASVRQQDIVAQELDMAKIIEEVEGRLELMIFQYHARIEKPAEWPVVMGYAPWIEEVWSNYISNAIKYGGMPPIIELGSTPLEDGNVCFWVKDNGNGLPEEAQSSLFTSYTRFDRPDFVPVEGHGLGLSIVKRIIDKMNGKVSVESTNTPGEGCIFGFTLPRPLASGE
jgi:signal transduction histidine kinase